MAGWTPAFILMHIRRLCLTLPLCCLALAWLTVGVCLAQESGEGSTTPRLILKAEPVEDVDTAMAEEEEKEPEKKAPLDATWRTQTQARTLTLSIPAPRGQIVDRNGEPLGKQGRSEIAWYDDMSLLPHMFRLLNAWRIDAKLVLLTPLPHTMDRKALCAEAERMIRQAI